MPTMQFRVNVTWNGTTVMVNPDPVPAYQGRAGGDSVQITWQPSGGTFQSNSFSWKSGSNPNWTPSFTNGNLVSPVYNPATQPNLYYNITIYSNGTPHTLDPEIENVPPGTDVEPGKPPKTPPPPGQTGKPQGGQGGPGGGNTGNNP